jgi:hypothetical protein
LELFLHDQPEPTPVLLKVALAHVQFETIHPFLDGNGRLLAQVSVFFGSLYSFSFSLISALSRFRYFAHGSCSRQKILHFRKRTVHWENENILTGIANHRVACFQTACRLKSKVPQTGRSGVQFPGAGFALRTRFLDALVRNCRHPAGQD